MTDAELTRARFASSLERADAAADRVRHRVVGVIAASVAVALAVGWTQFVELVA